MAMKRLVIKLIRALIAHVGKGLSANVPGISIISPNNYQIFTNNPASISIIATNTGTMPISSVEFYADGALVGTDATASTNAYSQPWTSPPNGLHLLKAVANGINGIRGESRQIMISLKDPANPL